MSFAWGAPAAREGPGCARPESIVGMLDEQQRTVLRITPDKTFFQE